MNTTTCTRCGSEMLSDNGGQTWTPTYKLTNGDQCLVPDGDCPAEHQPAAVRTERVAPHLLPESCFICGYGKHEPGEHIYTSNAQADAYTEAVAYFAARQPNGAGDVEARYVEQTRGR